jgi:hypothetical protein
MMHPTKWPRPRPFHHMRFVVGDLMLFLKKKKEKKKLVQARFWLLLLASFFNW